METTISIKKAQVERLLEEIKELETVKSPSPEINNYKDICDTLLVDSSDESIKLEVPGFDEKEYELLLNTVKLIRIAKVSNKGVLPKKGDYRYSPWFNLSSGFVFDRTDYVNSRAHASSASRLCFLDSNSAQEAAIKFPEVFKGIIQL